MPDSQFSWQTKACCSVTKDAPNISEEFEAETERNVKFPKYLRQHRKGKALATFYKHPEQSQPCGVYWRPRVDGKPGSQFKDFSSAGSAGPALTIA